MFIENNFLFQNRTIIITALRCVHNKFKRIFVIRAAAAAQTVHRQLNKKKIVETLGLFEQEKTVR